VWSCRCILQYVWITLVAATVGVCAFFLDKATDFSREILHYVNAASTGIILVSQGLAMYGLVLLYHGLNSHHNERLKPLRPLMKLASIKLLVIVTMWQSQIISLLNSQFHVFEPFAGEHSKSQKQWTQDEIADGVKNFALIMEMFLLSLWHHSVYPVSDSEPEVLHPSETIESSSKWLAVWDFFNDIRQFRLSLGVSARSLVQTRDASVPLAEAGPESQLSTLSDESVKQAADPSYPLAEEVGELATEKGSSSV